MRIHVAAALYALYFATYYDFSKAQYAVLFIVIALVMAAEMINTAIEEAVDLETDSFNFKAKAAKDIAAGAVFICALFAVVIGVLLYFDTEIIKNIVTDHVQNPVRLIAFLCSVILAVVFVRHGLGNKKM